MKFNSFCVLFDDWTLLKGYIILSHKMLFEQKKKKPGLKFNPGLALIGLQTTGPWSGQVHL